MARPKKTATEELLVTVDLGTSGIKAAGSIDGKKSVHTILVPPEIIEISEQTAREQEYIAQDAINGIWVMVNNKYFAIGSLARDLMATAIISQAKSQFACEKTAAVIWLMLKHFNLTGRVKVKIIGLLPPGELRERDLLQEIVVNSLKNFETPDGPCLVEIEPLVYLPEGIGVLEIFKAWYSEDLKGVNIGVVMMGHRNTSFFSARNSRLGTFRSSEIGFSRIIQNLGLPVTEQLAEGASRLLASEDVDLLSKVLKDRGVINQEGSLKNLIEVINKEKGLQVRAILQWLSEIISSTPIDMVLVAGGAADSFKVELIEYFDRFLPSLPNSKEAGIFFHGGKESAGDSRTRFKDISGVWNYLAD